MAFRITGAFAAGMSSATSGRALATKLQRRPANTGRGGQIRKACLGGKGSGDLTTPACESAAARECTTRPYRAGVAAWAGNAATVPQEKPQLELIAAFDGAVP